MLDRLKETELAKVADHYREHPLLKSCQRAFKRYQANMAPLLFSPEEDFCEAAAIIDNIIKLPQTDELQAYIAELWNDLRIRLSKWEKTATVQNLDMATSAILYTVAIAMSRHWTTFYNTDVTSWIFKAVMSGMKVDVSEMEHVFYDLLEEGDGIEDWINNNYDGHLSDEIASVLKGKILFASAVSNPQKAKAIIQRLHELMVGKTKPKDVMMPIRAAMDAGVIRRPTDEEFNNEFGADRVKGKSSFNNYTNPDNSPYTGKDFEAMIAEFKKINEE